MGAAGHDHETEKGEMHKDPGHAWKSTVPDRCVNTRCALALKNAYSAGQILVSSQVHNATEFEI